MSKSASDSESCETRIDPDRVNYMTGYGQIGGLTGIIVGAPLGLPGMVAGQLIGSAVGVAVGDKIYDLREGKE